MHEKVKTVFKRNKQADDAVSVWTFQTLDVWEQLLEKGSLFVDPGKSEYISDWPEPYTWMCKQMGLRLSSYQGHYPWWAWHRPFPDLRKWHGRTTAHELRGVRLKLALPRDCLLLSDYIKWHTVLLHMYIAKNQNDYDFWETELDINNVDETEWPLPEPWRSRVIASWDRIFDVTTVASEEKQREAWIQATFEVLSLENVLEATEFSARSPKRNL